VIHFVVQPPTRSCGWLKSYQSQFLTLTPFDSRDVAAFNLNVFLLREYYVELTIACESFIVAKVWQVPIGAELFINHKTLFNSLVALSGE